MKNLYLIFVCSVATMGGLMFGFDVAIISGAVPFIQEYFGWNELQLGWGVSSLLVGAIVGAFVSGPLSDRFGRRWLMLAVSLFFAVSCAGTAMAESSTFFIAMRLLGGISVGSVSVLAPMYVAEIAPMKVRGRLVSVYQLLITFGILVSYFINYSLHDVANNWRWMFASGIVPSVLYFVGLIFIPESPRWLFVKGEKDRAKRILDGMLGSEEASREVAQIGQSVEVEASSAAGSSGWAMLSNPAHRKVLFVGFLLAVLVQMCGINTVIDYAPKILQEAGVEMKNALLQTSFIGIINFLATFFAIWLIEKLGRRKLYIVGSIAMMVTHGLLAGSFHFGLHPMVTLCCLLLFIASFAAFIGPVFWTLVSEIFPNAIRGKGVAFASFTQWIFNFLVILLFPVIFKSFGGVFSFLFFAVMCLIQLLVVYFMVPETKGKSLEEIENFWK